VKPPEILELSGTSMGRTVYTVLRLFSGIAALKGRSEATVSRK